MHAAKLRKHGQQSKAMQAAHSAEGSTMEDEETETGPAASERQWLPRFGAAWLFMEAERRRLEPEFGFKVAAHKASQNCKALGGYDKNAWEKRYNDMKDAGVTRKPSSRKQRRQVPPHPPQSGSASLPKKVLVAMLVRGSCAITWEEWNALVINYKGGRRFPD